ncbi:MAG: GTPase HflX [Clostridiales bacterium]|jgi:GTP-binding protein HflX|nr:GTPase HflX [Eubacteriales bacterium]MDH7566488.1 GTPase HflX [Clostridiales bacterium]
MEELYGIQAGSGEFLPEELARRLADLTGRINREIAVYLDRKGSVVDVSVGDSTTVSLDEVHGKRDEARLSGIRCVHTHPTGEGQLSAVDLNAALKLKLDAIAAVGVKDGTAVEIYAALPARGENGEFSRMDLFGPFAPGDGKINLLLELILDRDRTRGNTAHEIREEEERAVLVGLEAPGGKVAGQRTEGERSLEELQELAVTAGVTVLHKVLQRKEGRNSAYYIGKGKVDELNLLRQALDANVIIFDDELSGAQIRNLEKAVGVKVIDRTALILDIFAQRARSMEGKLQVELAQLKYRLPRLTGLGGQLSRLGGGIGTRGPGEKKLEVDRRHIRRRIDFLQRELEKVGRRRGILREGRSKDAIPTVAVVGYTNAGKSSLMNALCKCDVLAEDRLFATLDPATRKFHLPDGREALLTDTVGFIRKLPHDLVEAFKSTLEEAVYADVLIHVADVTSEELGEHIAVVDEILDSLGASGKPVILALNKTDLRRDAFRVAVESRAEKVFEISAKTGQGLDELLKGISELMPAEEEEVELLVPYSEGRVLSYIYENGKLLDREFTGEGIRVKVRMRSRETGRVKEFLVRDKMIE